MGPKQISCGGGGKQGRGKAKANKKNFRHIFLGAKVRVSSRTGQAGRKE